MGHSPESPAPPRPDRSWWRQPLVWLGFGLSALAVATFLALFDLPRVLASMGRLRPLYLLPGAALILLAFLVRTLRWRLLLRPVSVVPFGQLRDVLIMGFMLNNVLPARAGEVVRVLALWKVAGTSRRATLATVATERMFDVVALLGILTALGLLFEVPPWTRRLGSVTLLLLGCFAVGICWLAFHHRSLFRLVGRVLFFLPAEKLAALLRFMERFVDGTRALRSPGLIAGALLTSLLVWSLEAGAYLAVMRGMELPLPLWAAALALVVSNFGMAAPSAPGYVGVFDAACSGSLVALGLPAEEAISYALVLHLLLWVTVTSSGLLAMWHLDLKLLRPGS